MTPPGPITRLGAQRAAIRELSKGIYHRQSDPWPVRAFEAIGRWISHLLSTALSAAPSGSAGALALVVLIVVIIIVIVWRVGIPRASLATGSVLPAGQVMTAAEHRALAEQAAENDDWHTAVIEGMRAIARELEERDVLQPRAGRTATELANEAAGFFADATAELRAAADTFNHIAYGEGTATPADLEVMIAADDIVCRASRSQVVAI